MLPFKSIKEEALLPKRVERPPLKSGKGAKAKMRFGKNTPENFKNGRKHEQEVEECPRLGEGERGKNFGTGAARGM